MSRVRKTIGAWIALVVFGIIFPGGFYVISAWLDDLLGLSPALPVPLNVFAAVFALTIGLFWMLWAYSYLHFVGGGSPVEVFGIALYPTQRLVTTGPYAYTRNPMLLGLLFILLAIALAGNSTAGLILVPIIALVAIAYIKRFEEPGLVRRFGEEYIKYRKSVPALIPGFRQFSAG